MHDHLVGLPARAIDGLGDGDARTLLLGTMHGPLDAAVSDQIIAECHGNPLALLELPRSWAVWDLAGGFGLPDRQPVADKIEVDRVLAEATDADADPAAWFRSPTPNSSTSGCPSAES